MNLASDVMMRRMGTKRPPRDNLYRATTATDAFELRSDDDDAMPTLVGHFARFGEWAEIDSMWEGHFLERIEKGAFAKTFRESGNRIRPLFQHGQDPQVGDKVLGMPEVLREDEQGAWYEVPLFDTGYNRDLIPGLEAGAYGASFRFRVVREEMDEEPSKTKHNPDGLPERTIKEAEVMEFGPVTFPAYAGATAGVRSMTDEFFVARMTDDPQKLARMIEFALDETPAPPAPVPAPQPEPPKSTPASATSTPLRTKEEPSVDVEQVSLDRFTSKADLINRDNEISDTLTAMHTALGTRARSAEQEAEWSALEAEQDAIKARVAEIDKREARVERGHKQGGGEPTYVPPIVQQTRSPDNPFDVDAVRRDSRSVEEEERKLRSNARYVLEAADFPDERISREDAQTHIANLLATRDQRAALSRWMLATGSELYDRAFGKYLSNQMRTPEEDRALHKAQEVERALSLTGASGGFAIPFTLDPTILGTSNGAVNPWRQLARVETITGDEWRGVSSAGVTVAYAAEATETTDNAPTLVQPTVSTEKAQAFIPFSIEVGMDWDGLRGEMSRLLAEGKDELESAKFATGSGTNEPFGVITGTTNTVNAGAGGTFTLANLYALQAALPPRYRPRAAFVGNLAILQRVRQFETTGGSTSAVWVDGLQPDNPAQLLGRPAYEASEMSAVSTVGAKFLLFGDFSRFLIVDRIGLTVEVMEHLVGTNHRPTGQRGLYAYFRNGSKVLDANAFRVLLGLA